jgi:DNA-binding response OmpR family regulator
MDPAADFREFKLRLLVVEDHRALVANLFEFFEARGHEMDAAPDGLAGLHLAGSQKYDALIVDWMMPRLDGAVMLRRLRLRGDETPAILLTARDRLDDKIDGFRSGADDYLTKPFALPELEVRLLALVARARRSQPSRRMLSLDDLSLDLDSMEATRAGTPLSLYPACRKLLEVLLRAVPRVVPRAELEQALWGSDTPDGDLLRSHIYELRKVIDAPFPTKLLHTVPKLGYRLARAHAG